MQTVLTVLLGLAMLAVLAVLLGGVLGLVRGDTPARSGRLMRLRVAFQAIALILLTVLFLTTR